MRIHRAWLVAAVTFLALISAAAFRSTTSILFMPIEMEFGWTRETTSLAVSVNLVLYGITAPFAATLMERFSIRKVTPIALLLIALGSGLTVFMTQPWQLILLWGVFVGLGTGAIALVFGSMVANRWFKHRRGLVTGIFSAAYATGQLLFLPALSVVVANSGWRVSSVVVAATSLAIIPIFYIVFRDRPSDVGTTAFGGEIETAAVASGSHTFASTIRGLFEAARKPAFWILAGTFFVCGWTTNGLIGAHFIPAAHDHGMPATTAASLLAVVGIFDFVGTILSGYLTDKVDSVILLVFYYGLRGLALLTVPFVLGPNVEPPLLFFIVFYGLDWIATVPPTVELCRKHFGIANSGLICGWVFASHMVGAAAASAFAGAIRQYQGDYFVAWIVAAVLCIAASAYSLTLRNKKTAAIA